MPYRDPQQTVRARFSLRTPPGFWAVAALQTSVAVGVVGLVVWASLERGTAPSLVWILVAAHLLLVAGMWTGSAPYRIGGGAGDLVVYDDRIEVPGTRKGEIVVLPRSTFRIEVTPVRASIGFGALPLVSFRRGEILTLRSGATVRRLSSLTSPEPELGNLLTRALLTEEEQARLDGLFDQMGEMLRAQGPARDDLDQRLDDELAELERRR